MGRLRKDPKQGENKDETKALKAINTTNQTARTELITKTVTKLTTLHLKVVREAWSGLFGEQYRSYCARKKIPEDDDQEAQLKTKCDFVSQKGLSREEAE